MFLFELRNYLQTIPDEANILIFVGKTGETRQLLFSDIDRNHDGNIVIDTEYEVPVKTIEIRRPLKWAKK